jgi:lipopolysaccharide export system protein LptC
MLGRLYAIIFISLIAFSLWFQRKYLERSAKEFNSQLDFENSVLPTSIAKNFNTNSYQDGKLKYSFSGDKITYYNDNHFEAEGNLVYQAFDENNRNSITIKTQKAYGQIESDISQSAQSALPLGTNSRLKSAILPNDVLFDFEGNRGKTYNVFIDMDNEIIQSQNHFISNGPQGNIKGKGFYYSIKNEEFKIKSNVNGDFKINKTSQNKN